MIELTPLDIAKFWMQVKIDEDSKICRTANEYFGHCWIWTGSLFLSGYGRFFLRQEAYRAHRIAFYLCNCTLPKENFICHRCDNKKCVNPKHLWSGTPKENTDDMIKKGRLVREKPKKHKQVGISYRKESGKWRARIMVNYKNYLIGSFDTEEQAINARKLFGE
jgi:hypothetical protein